MLKDKFWMMMMMRYMLFGLFWMFGKLFVIVLHDMVTGL